MANMDSPGGMAPGQKFEFRGTVGAACDLSVTSMTALNDTFDCKLYNDFINEAKKPEFAAIFGLASE